MTDSLLRPGGISVPSGCSIHELLAQLFDQAIQDHALQAICNVPGIRKEKLARRLHPFKLARMIKSFMGRLMGFCI
jgi:hypothetical protein